MRIFMFLLSLIFCGAFICLNILGFNGTLSQTEFILISLIAEVLLCLILGHFMFRSYANYKRAKKLSQELASVQNVLETQAATAKAAAEQVRHAQEKDNPSASEKSAQTRSTDAMASVTPADTQPLPQMQPPTDNDSTTLFQTPFKN